MAQPPRLELDPHGDIELILLHTNAQPLLWSSDIKQSLRKSKKQKKKERKALRLAQQLAIEEADSNQLPPEAGFAENVLPEANVPELRRPTPDEFDSNAEAAISPGNEDEAFVKPKYSGPTNELRMLVSSRHLSLASLTFRKMLNGPWLEGSSSSSSGLIREVRATEWDASAFLIVQDIIHGHGRLVPTSLSVELLAKIAAIVDYYDCHDVTEPFVDRWIQDLRGNFPSSYGKDCVLWLSISWVFLRVDVLQKMAVLAIKGCEPSVETMGLPVPETLTRKCMACRFQNFPYILTTSPSQIRL